MKRSHESMITEVQEVLAAADVPAAITRELMDLPEEMIGEIATRLGAFSNLSNLRLANTQMHGMVSDAMWAPVRRLKHELEMLLRRLDWVRPQPEIQRAFRKKRDDLQKLLFPEKETGLSRMMLLCPALSVMTEERFSAISQRIRIKPEKPSDSDAYDLRHKPSDEAIRVYGFVSRPESRSMRLYANVAWALERFDQSRGSDNYGFSMVFGREWFAESSRRFESFYLHPKPVPSKNVAITGEAYESTQKQRMTQANAIEKLLSDHLNVPLPQGYAPFCDLVDFWLNDAHGMSVLEFLTSRRLALDDYVAYRFFASRDSIILG